MTKKILADAGFPVPAGDEFTSLEQGLAYYPLIKDKQIVVKPKSTNFGLGISIFQEPASLDNYKKASRLPLQKIQLFLLKNLSQEPNTVSLSWMDVVRLYSFVSLPMLSVMANTPFVNWSLRKMPIHCEDVITAHHLKIIALGDIEQLMLTQQGYTPDDILPEGKKGQSTS